SFPRSVVAGALHHVERRHEAMVKPHVDSDGVVARDEAPALFGDLIDGRTAAEDEKRLAPPVLREIHPTQSRNPETESRALEARELPGEIPGVVEAQEQRVRQLLDGVLQRGHRDPPGLSISHQWASSNQNSCPQKP